MKRITLAILLLLVGSTQSYGMFSRLRPLAARIAPKTARLSISALRLGLSHTPASHLVSTKASVARPTVWQKRALMGLVGTMGVVGIAMNTQPAQAQYYSGQSSYKNCKTTSLSEQRKLSIKICDHSNDPLSAKCISLANEKGAVCCADIYCFGNYRYDRENFHFVDLKHQTIVEHDAQLWFSQVKKIAKDLRQKELYTLVHQDNSEQKKQLQKFGFSFSENPQMQYYTATYKL